MSRLHRFAQPSEVAEPIELLRAGMLFHARGLINTRTIQHNLDWVWPFWIERQFNPHDPAFVPRAFSITHVNLTHRNWTAVGQPDCEALPLVDPRGLLTPIFDGWSLDTWIIPDEGQPLLPSRAENVSQRLCLDDTLAVETHVWRDGLSLRNTVDLVIQDGVPVARLSVLCDSNTAGALAVSLRPVNPEGVSFIHEAEFDTTERRLAVNGNHPIEFSASPDDVLMSHYRQGDVLQDLPATAPGFSSSSRVTCDVGLATAAVLFRVSPRERMELLVRIPLDADMSSSRNVGHVSASESRQMETWSDATEGLCRLRVPDERLQFLFDAAVRNLILHSPGEVYAGPYTYKRFWFRDAAFILNALLAIGAFDRARRVIDMFPSRQKATGYFHSQEGEWDSNGQALWIIDRYQQFSGEALSGTLVDSVERGARWIIRKRLSDKLSEPHAGLLPAGFSAEHLGPNDFYYWDDFWAVAGLLAAARILVRAGREKASREVRAEANAMMEAIERSIEQSRPTRERQGVPASPYRRMDSGAIGSITVGYPLQLWPADDPRLLRTAEFLLANCMVDDGFFQDMIHSGVNAYLTLHLAQVLLRANDPRHWSLVRRVAELASPTGQWPEAVHPLTGGGCMGDGQHMWAAAEWVLMLRSCLIREEADRLVLGSGLPREWLAEGASLGLETAPTWHGPARVEVERCGEVIRVDWDIQWRDNPVPVEVRLPGCDPEVITDERQSVSLAVPPDHVKTGRPVS